MIEYTNEEILNVLEFNRHINHYQRDAEKLMEEVSSDRYDYLNSQIEEMKQQDGEARYQHETKLFLMFLNIVKVGKKEVVEKLIKSDDFKNLLNEYFRVPGALLVAAQYGHSDLANTVLDTFEKDLGNLKFSTRTENYIKFILLHATRNGMFDVTEKLSKIIKIDTVVESLAEELIKNSIIHDQPDRMKTLLGDKLFTSTLSKDPNNLNFMMLLVVSSSQNNLDVILKEEKYLRYALGGVLGSRIKGVKYLEQLLKNEDFKHFYDQYPKERLLYRAISVGNLNLMTYLIDKSKSDIIADNPKLYFGTAIESADIKIVEQLLKNDSVKEAIKNDEALQFLYMAMAEKEQHNVLKTLLQNTNVLRNIKNCGNATQFLQRAIDTRHPEIISALLSSKIFIESVQKEISEKERSEFESTKKVVQSTLLSTFSSALSILSQNQIDDIYTKNKDIRNIIDSLKLIKMAEDREGSMRSSTKNDAPIFKVVMGLYKNEYINQGLEKILNDLKEYLEKQYETHPAVYNGQKLPMNYDKNLAEDGQKSYLHNDYHTAWRLLFLPYNHWMSSKASNISVEEGIQRADVSQEALETIAYLWLAVSDKQYDMEQNKVSDRRLLFCQGLHGLARGHNLDTGLDDNDFDKPSCGPGMMTRLVTEAVVDHPLNERPESRELNVGIILERFINDFINNGDGSFRKQISSMNFEKLKTFRSNYMFIHGPYFDAYEKATLVDLAKKEPGYNLLDTGGKHKCIKRVSEQRKEMINEHKEVFKISDKEMDIFLKSIESWFGEKRFKEDVPDKYFDKWESDSYPECVEYIRKNIANLARECVLNLIEEKIRQLEPTEHRYKRDLTLLKDNDEMVTKSIEMDTTKNRI